MRLAPEELRLKQHMCRDGIRPKICTAVIILALSSSGAKGKYFLSSAQGLLRNVTLQFHSRDWITRERTEEEVKLDEVIPGDDPSDKDMVEVINPSAGVVEKIRRDDPQYCSADGFKTRGHEGSSKPMDIPSFVWQSASVKARREAIREEQMKLARSGAEKKKAARAEKDLEKLEKSKKGVASIINQPHQAYHPEDDDVPAMPT